MKSRLIADQDALGVDARLWVDNFVASLTPAQKYDIGSWVAGLTNRPLPTNDQELAQLIEAYPQLSVKEYLTSMVGDWLSFQKYDFKALYHPFVCDFVRILNDPLQGMKAMMARETQLRTSAFDFGNAYGAQPVVVGQPAETVDFSLDGAYSLVQLGAVLPRAAADRQRAEPEPALRGGARLVPLHLQPDRRRRARPRAARR